jgi:hypothetical protein
MGGRGGVVAQISTYLSQASDRWRSGQEGLESELVAEITLQLSYVITR